jgi:hypothetical protein
MSTSTLDPNLTTAEPVRSEIIGESNPDVEKQANQINRFMNWYLTQRNKDFSSDSERLLYSSIFYGGPFKE